MCLGNANAIQKISDMKMNIWIHDTHRFKTHHIDIRTDRNELFNEWTMLRILLSSTNALKS